MIIIQDTREKQKLFHPSTNLEVINKRLTEGDYSTPLLEEKLVCERKSAIDLYGSILKGHERFKREILRAKEKNKVFHIFVECEEKDFYNLSWVRNNRIKPNPAQLGAIIRTMQERHAITFHWCCGRDDMRLRILSLLLYEESLLCPT